MKKAFTLVELLFVMAIIAILAGFALNQYNKAIELAYRTSMYHDMKNIINMEKECYLETGEYSDINIYPVGGQYSTQIGTMCGKEVPISSETGDYFVLVMSGESGACSGTDSCFSVTASNYLANDRVLTLFFHSDKSGHIEEVPYIE